MTTLIDYIKEVANQKTGQDDDEYNAMDHSGGNFDDAYGNGVDDGYIMLARHLVKKFNL